MATGEGAESRLKRKEAFYAGLHNALADSDDEVDEGRKASEFLLRKASTRKAPTADQHASKGIERSVSETNLAKKTIHPLSDSAQPDRPSTSGGQASRATPSLKKGATFAAPPIEAMALMAPPTAIPQVKQAKTGSKRKRGEDLIKLVPEPDKIFKRMHFYYFPDNDKNPARAMKIMKALEFGATWQKDWHPCVTHVIVEKQFEFSTVLKCLKMDALPQRVAVVNDAWPPDCMTFRMVMDVKQQRFQVKGYTAPTTEKPTDAQPPVVEKDRSLELKPAPRSVMARSPESPRTTDEAAVSQQPGSPPRMLSETGNGDDAPGQAEIMTTIASTTEFDEAIRQAKELQDVPLEDDGEAESRPTSSEGPDTDDEEQPKGKRRSKYQTKQDKFQCMQKHTGKSDNPNAATIAILQQMANYYDQVGDQWRPRAYRKAMSTLRNHPTKVWTKAEAISLPQIGERLAEKIEEIAYTNRLRRLDNAKAEPGDQILQTFMGVYGAGFVKASEWVAQGYKTLDELLAKATLTDSQRIGIEHYEDFNSRIPRSEVAQHGAYVRRALQKIDPSFEVIVGGSYRRGAKDSGDIDCLITHPNTHSAHLRIVVLEQLVPALFKSGFLVASLATTNKDDGSKWHGASCLPTSKTWRRIDLLLVPSDEIGAALIYFTGNDIFNRSLRLLASTKGMRLNQRGLYQDAMRDRRREKISDGIKVEGESEERIFEILGVPWRPPEHRIC